MSAIEIIEQIKALPKNEQREVFAFVREAGESPDTQGVRYADSETFRKVVDRVFEKHDELFRRLAE